MVQLIGNIPPHMLDQGEDGRVELDQVPHKYCHVPVLLAYEVGRPLHYFCII